MSDIEIIIHTVDGWAPTTRLYRIDGEHWLIQCMDMAAATQMVARARSQLEALGIDAPSETAAVPPGPTAIFRATVTRTPVWEDVVDFPDGPPTAGDFSVTEHDDGSATFYLDGEQCGTRTRVHVSDTISAVTPIDADGDPLNGLTPRWVLPAGTTFDDALDHILTNTPTPD